MFCSKCGAQIDDNAAVCSNCGTPTAPSAQPNQQPPTPPVAQVPKKKKKKWWIIILVIVIIFAIFWIIGSSGDDADQADNNAISSSAEAENNVGDYKVELKDSRVTEDYEGSKILIVTYTFTNNSEEAEAFSYAVTDKAFQNGIELGDVWSSYGIDGFSFDNKSKEVQPGYSLDVQCAYALNDETTDVEIRLEQFSIWSDGVEQTFTIKLS